MRDKIFFRDKISIMFEGRVSRKEFNYVFLGLYLILLFVNLTLVDNPAVPAEMDILGLVTWGLWFVFAIFFTVVIGIKRLHDIGRSGFWILLLPIGFVLILPILMFMKGNVGANKYGKEPVRSFDVDCVLKGKCDQAEKVYEYKRAGEPKYTNNSDFNIQIYTLQSFFENNPGSVFGDKENFIEKRDKLIKL